MATFGANYVPLYVMIKANPRHTVGLFNQKVCDLLNWIPCLRAHLNYFKYFSILKAAIVR